MSNPTRTQWITPTKPPPGASGAPAQQIKTVPKPVDAAPTNAPPTNAAPAGERPVGTEPPRRSRSRPAAERQPTPDRLVVRRLDDPLLTDGVPVGGFYAERYYSPIVGPTCILLLRSLAQRLLTDVEGFEVETASLAAGVGCSAKAGQSSQFWKAVRRGARFGLLRQIDHRLLVRTELDQLSTRMVQRLPRDLRHEHRAWVRTEGPSPTPLLEGGLPPVPLEPIRTLRLAARGLCTAEELRALDRARMLR